MRPEVGERVQVTGRPTGTASVEAIGARFGVLQRVDGAVCWVLLDGDLQALPFTAGQVEKR
jgi:hypothetical protein